MNDTEEVLPENLAPPVKVGDAIQGLVRTVGGGWFWGPRVVVKWLSSDGTIYFRHKHGKVDKTYAEYRIVG